MRQSASAAVDVAQVAAVCAAGGIVVALEEHKVGQDERGEHRGLLLRREVDRGVEIERVNVSGPLQAPSARPPYQEACA